MAEKLKIRLKNAASRLFDEVDGSSVRFFRIAFGAVMLWEVFRFFQKGWIAAYYIDPIMHFTYYGFGWVKPWPGNGMYAHFAALGILAFLIMIGKWYRTAAALFFLGFAYVFLLDQARYLNHFYLVVLISFVLIFIPAARGSVPAWSLWLLRAMVGIPYFFGGIAKINPDWLRAEPMRDWLSRDTDFPVIGRFFADDRTAYFFSYSGLLLDLLIVPFLIWKKTRYLAFIAALSFHLMNSQLFQIGIFPWFMIAGTLIFFEPDWPKRLLSRIRRKPMPEMPPMSRHSGTFTAREKRILAALGAFMFVQVVVPFRHLLYPGNVHWTDEGHRFSWHMKLRDKNTRVGFVIRDPETGEAWAVDPKEHLAPYQLVKLGGLPDMILQYAHFLGRMLKEQGHPNYGVHAVIFASLNGREYQPYTDPETDLLKEKRSLKPAGWIVPLTTPLKKAVDTEAP